LNASDSLKICEKNEIQKLKANIRGIKQMNIMKKNMEQFKISEKKKLIINDK
jgi:hypothetical protein